jgi:polygalacturonase
MLFVFLSFALSLSIRDCRQTFNVLHYGAIGDGVTLNTISFRKAVQAASDEATRFSDAAEGYTCVVVPKGSFLTGGFVLSSNVALYLDRHAIIIASDDPTQYPVIESVTWDTGPVR